jgi:hypothetical protein
VKYWYDTEFLEDGRTIDLISIGIVAEDGREYYAVSEEIEAGLALDRESLGYRIRHNRWLMENVIPHLPLRTENGITKPCQGSNEPPNFWLDMDNLSVLPRRLIRSGVRQFLLPGAPDSDPELWAWYGAYDHVALCQLFGSMINLPKGLPMWTNDFKQTVHQAGNPRIAKQESGLHNALEDARWLRDAWLAFQGRGPL